MLLTALFSKTPTTWNHDVSGNGLRVSLIPIFRMTFRDAWLKYARYGPTDRYEAPPEAGHVHYGRGGYPPDLQGATRRCFRGGGV